MNAWWKSAGLPKCEHEWEYVPREKDEHYTGYLERCKRCERCGEVVQVVQ